MIERNVTIKCDKDGCTINFYASGHSASDVAIANAQHQEWYIPEDWAINENALCFCPRHKPGLAGRRHPARAKLGRRKNPTNRGRRSDD